MIKVPHALVYGVIAFMYAGSCFGLDKTLVAVILTAAYVLLAVEKEVKRRPLRFLRGMPSSRSLRFRNR